jgi:hypothetical protein
MIMGCLRSVIIEVSRACRAIMPTGANMGASSVPCSAASAREIPVLAPIQLTTLTG